MTPIVHSLAPITLIGGGVIGPTDLEAALHIAPTCVAADGGARAAIAAGVNLKAIIGDFDSVDPGDLAEVPLDRHHFIGEQNSTDFDKCLRHIAAPAVVAVGFSGGRIDHQLAALHTLVAQAHCPCVILGADEIVFHCPRNISVPTQAKEVVSLFPMTEVAGHSVGLEWPISELRFAPDRYVGTSNRATGPIELSMKSAGMLCILPRRLLPEVTQALAVLPDHAKWPARAE